jgi:hypothetical protein
MIYCCQSHRKNLFTNGNPHINSEPKVAELVGVVNNFDNS